MVQRRMLTALLASAAWISVAHAADLGMRAPPPPAPVVPIFTWSGFYVGANVGAGFSNSDKSNYTYVDPLEGPPPSSTVLGLGSAGNRDFLGGGQVGFNWQMNSIVLGLEADWDFANQAKRNGFFAKQNNESAVADSCSSPAALCYDHFLSSARGAGDFGTVRGRLGWAMDHTLLYVTGGLAFGSTNKVTIKDYRLQAGAAQLASYSGVPVDVFYDNNTGTAFGYALGAGFEYALSPNWSVKAEYLYVSLDGGGSGQLLEGTGPDFGPNPGNIGTITASNGRDSFSLVRVGLNYRFGSYSAPTVVAAY